MLRGCATFTLDGAQVDAPAGTFVVVDPAVHRRAVAAESGTAVLALGGRRVDRGRPPHADAAEGPLHDWLTERL